ncbi:MAG TPA: hypothetical protein PLO24_00675 [Bacteroidales bacterium]|jgi:hypothetical protein|nr:hypothetical protein [Bacteroidales bacterium]HOS72337.1 hypothetical protein [Bacteroidales bacterium]HQH25027.1 hypothetical protein [Bacteroidales bacterium]HQJ82449.1 hypothetical protein [Bacteroidales bacterium]
MKIKEIFRIAMAGIILLAVTPDTAGQTFSVTFDLHDMCRKNQITTYNRQTDCFTENGTKIIRLSGNNGYGIAWIRGMEFADGIIEVDIRAGSEIQHFAAGLAFHGLGSDTLDAVYLRRSVSPEDKKTGSHRLFYTSLPAPASEESNNHFLILYKKAFSPRPDAKGWIHLRISVQGDQISAFAGRNDDPFLVVERQGRRTGGRIGFWTGDMSGGDFANLRISTGPVKATQ